VSSPALLDLPDGRLAVVALTDNEPEWEATERGPGINYIAYDQRGMLEPYRSRVAESISRARHHAGFVIVSAHVGFNWGAPSAAMRALAHELLDLGADLYWGHSNHTPQGVECYGGKAILYSTGDFIDDYAVDPIERNDLSFLFVLEGGHGQLAHIRLHPVAIERFRVRRATSSEAALLEARMRAKCAAFGTTLEFQDGAGYVRVR
jgi:poly-gamma-glutamate synthesis protein (capsule biosynthesis protein)